MSFSFERRRCSARKPIGPTLATELQTQYEFSLPGTALLPCSALRLQLPQIGQECRALFRPGLSIPVHAVRRSNRGHDVWRSSRLHKIEELDIVIDDVLPASPRCCCESRAQCSRSREARARPVCSSRRLGAGPQQIPSAVRDPDRSSFALVFVPFASVISNVRAFDASCGAQGAKAKRAGVAASTGRGHWVAMSWNRKTTGNFVVDCPAPPWQCPHARAKTALPCVSRLIERRIRIRQRERSPLVWHRRAHGRGNS